jgi:hypothetical protein
MSGRERELPVYQNIKYGTGLYKLPRDLRTVLGAYLVIKGEGTST